jgi:glycosyltransferase involved in cell wall biosynthesis
MRVLYVLGPDPQISDACIEAEIRYMHRLGVHGEIWSENESTVAARLHLRNYQHRLEDAIRTMQPDLVHIHGLDRALQYEPVVASRELPVTARAHSATPDAIRSLLHCPAIRGIFVYPHHPTDAGLTDPRVRVIRNGFDTSRFTPSAEKDRRLVLRASAAPESSDLPFFLELARRVLTHRFVLAVAGAQHEAHVAELTKMQRRINSPAEILVDVPHEEMANWFARAGIYVHTSAPPGRKRGATIGQPISIAEAMATGCHVLVRDLPPLRDYIGDAGATYSDLDEAACLITATIEWSDEAWRQAANRSVDRAWEHYADDRALRPIYDAWTEILDAGASVPAIAMAPVPRHTPYDARVA